jgi:ribonuclease Z
MREQGLFSRSDYSASLLLEKSIGRIETARVKHCAYSFGIAVVNEGCKIVYSGDCRPSEKLIEIGMDADLLIHEATFYDSLIEEALKKQHSTISEAVSVGARMNAKNILLTHFSQRVIIVPFQQVSQLEDNVAYAFDGMSLPFADFWKMKHYHKVWRSGLTFQAARSLSADHMNGEATQEIVELVQ